MISWALKAQHFPAALNVPKGQWEVPWLHILIIRSGHMSNGYVRLTEAGTVEVPEYMPT